MSKTPALVFDFKNAVARQFSDRPTLRQVVSQKLLLVMLKECPWLAYVRPKLTSADPLILDSPAPGVDYWTTASLVDVVMQAMLDGKPLDLEVMGNRHHNLGLSSTHRFAASQREFDTRRLTGVTPALNTLTAELTSHYREALVDYWSGQSRSGRSRDQWLQLLIKMALLSNLPLQALDEQQRACLRGLLRGGDEQPAVFVIQARLATQDQAFTLLQPGLLVTGEWDERQVTLWCSPSSQVRAFDSTDDFAIALRDELALRYRFSAMTWDRYELEGNAFAQWVAVLLEGMLEQIGQLRMQGLTLAQVEGLLDALSDPAQWWIDGYHTEAAEAVAVPPGIGVAAASDSFAFQQALLDLALDQADADGLSALDGILDLQGYARQKLREQLLADYPTEANYQPDEVIVELKIAQGMPGGAGTGTGGGEPWLPAGKKTLTEFAIANLSALGDALITNITHATGQLIMPWMNADYVKRLVSQVNIGGHYPKYVADALDDPATRADRSQRFAREWRQSLRFSALQAKLDNKIAEAGLQVVEDLCQGCFDTQRDGGMFPLAFKRTPTSQRHDLVQGMYVLYSNEPARVLLYRPLYTADPVQQYANLADLMTAIRTPGALQDSILTWMDEDARPVYDQGGFVEPHVLHFGLDPYQLFEKPDPAQIDMQRWLTQVDEKLYAANRAMLIELANRQSTSNAESRWAILTKGAWLLFDTFSLVARGPVATVAWLMQTLAGLQSDGVAVEQGSEFQRQAAVIDLLLNLSMTLLHARLPSGAEAKGRSLPEAAAFDGPPAQDGGFASAWVAPSQGKVAMPGPFALPGQLQLDFSWRGNRGFNWLAPTQREALLAMRSETVLAGLKPSASGLYEQGGHQYLVMLGEVFAVTRTDEGVQIVDASGTPGPWLVQDKGAWRIDTRLRLSGGMPKGRLEQQFTKLQALADGLTVKAKAQTQTFARHVAEVVKVEGQIEHLDKLQFEETRKRDEAQSKGDKTFDMASSDRIMASYKARILALNEKQDAERRQAVATAESIVALDREQCQVLPSMLEPKYGTYRKAGFEQTLLLQKNTLLASVIQHSEFILNELQHMVDFPRMRELAAQFDDGVGPHVREQYRDYRKALEGAVALQERMLVAQGGLDEVLTQVDDTFEIGMGGVPRGVGQLIAGRKFTTVDLRFHHVMNLADLALHLDGGQRQLFRYREDLAGDALRSAGTAHGESLMANLSEADRISILQEAWDAYAAAIINALHLERSGGALVEPSMLARYRTHLQLLKDDAGRRLVNALAEQDGAGGATQRVPYPKTAVAQRAIRNREGLLVIATQAQSGALEVLDPISRQTLQIFDLKEGEYVQRTDAAPEPAQASTTEDDVLIQSLLKDNEDVLAIAEAYVRDDANGQLLQRLVERQIKRLQVNIDRLHDKGLAASRTAELSAAVASLEADKKRLLTELYSKTRYPTAQGLRFLHDQALIKVDYIRRDTAVATSPFDEFRITRLDAAGASKGHSIWAAHFHLPSQGAALAAFTHGHLKIWSQRFFGRQYEAASGNRVHRGRLTADDVQGIIPLT